ncbi:hypothetical protein HYH03_005589 [Edaphochlamys debaryana]|uniref:Cupin type-2 domain-containing protein n=1 Tax=Edaphochlamys debaryana TaxID=47281 RepID=A0A836C297_9CHLO|nr:hypothetical protein HYH03_005589 [Edaphochlamys debaryana]|eukprot:KAG2496359.1 hypothetical protein HYH03_005589 [Edaphochlamys debaryana]
MGKLTIHPGSGWPPHRHLAADEWLYVLSGEGGYAYWGMDHPEPTELSIGPGSVMFNQQGQLHKVWNNGSEPLVLFGVSKSIHPFEVLSDWPETPNGGAGHIPEVAPWDAFCAPGHDHGAEEWAEEGHGYEEGSHVEFESAGEEGSHVEFEAAGEL